MPVIVMLEDDVDRLDRFEAVAVKLGIEIVSWADANVMLAEVEPFLSAARLISLDHDLFPFRDIDPGDGLDVAKYLAARRPVCPVIVHTSNRIRGDMMMGEFELAGWEHHRVAPIGDDWIETDWFRLARRLLRARRAAE